MTSTSVEAPRVPSDPPSSPSPTETPPSEAALLTEPPPPAESDRHAARGHGGGHGHGAKLLPLAFAALGVVFGDIGTSPLYALKECFTGEHGMKAEPASVLGVLSLIIWTLVSVVAVKYLTFILRADNHGEGGILALLALVPPEHATSKRRGGRPALVALLVVFGAALLYGDGVITPAISVLSAVEGLEVATSTLKPTVVPLTLLILAALFLVQKRGTAGVGKIFGPVALLWFLTIGGLGLAKVLGSPSVLAAFDPSLGLRFLMHHGKHGFLVLGGVVLAITGAEALYADMGHFGKGPIRLAWSALVFPSLLLNYLGQGANLLAHPEAAQNPFYAIVPAPLLYPTVAIATAATVVASQALISGAFSLTQQAVQLGFFPRVTVIHTSKETEGQIYIPEINYLLMWSCMGLVLGFKSSGALAAAYGIAVTGTMAITTVAFYVVARTVWRWPLWKAFPLLALFITIDLAFFGASAVKFLDGGWFPVVMASGIYVVMMTWNTGRFFLGKSLAESMLPLQVFLEDVADRKPTRVRGTAVFMASNANGVPPILLHHFKHNQSLHEQLVLLTVSLVHIPEVPRSERVSLEPLGEGFYRVTVRYGFMQSPDVPSALADCKKQGLRLHPLRTSYYLGRETLLPTGRAAMASWRKSLFAFISRNARPATAYFGLPPNRVIELGMQVDL